MGTTTLLDFDTALARVLDGAVPLGTETATLDEALDRVLAEDVIARRTQPPFAVSAMDGYAVDASDCALPGAKLKVVASIAAGNPPGQTIVEGQAARIFTGAPVPDGADAILIQENAKQLSETAIAATAPVKRGQYIRPAGYDFTHGDPLLFSGRQLSPIDLSLAAAGNHAHLPVYRKPRIGILSSGDELTPPGSNLQPGQIVASNAVGVAAMITRAGGIPIDLGIARDTEDAIATKLSDTQAAKCDVFVTLGGASVGDHDLIHPVLSAQGARFDVYKVAMRPGKPLMFGQLGDMRILGLPGNPVSSLVCARVILTPLIAALTGQPPDLGRTDAITLTDIPQNGPRRHFMRAQISDNAAGVAEVRVLTDQDSSLLMNLSRANALIDVPANHRGYAKGDPVKIIAL
ncbi:MAG: gephyrin-like molybdotransferase Glp [Pseudomonadota bacterium]